jgi:hypothetical protein
MSTSQSTWPPSAHYDFLMCAVYDENPLDPLHRADLDRSGLSTETIARQKFRSVPPSMIDRLLGFRTPRVVSAYVLPFFSPRGELLADHIRLKVFPPIATKKGTITRPRVIERDPEARALWAAVYPKLSEGEGGLVGAILARAEAHVLRLSILYALLDGAPSIRPEHLRAALAVWDYAETSARRIFGEALGLSVADTILAALKRHGPLTRTQIRDLFGRNKPGSEIDAALELLAQKGKAKRSTRLPEGGTGRPVEIWEAT